MFWFLNSIFYFIQNVSYLNFTLYFIRDIREYIAPIIYSTIYLE